MDLESHDGTGDTNGEVGFWDVPDVELRSSNLRRCRRGKTWVMVCGENVNRRHSRSLSTHLGSPTFIFGSEQSQTKII